MVNRLLWCMPPLLLGRAGGEMGEPMRKAMGRWAQMRAACPASRCCLSGLSACPLLCLHGRILAAFHKTSSAFPVAPATLHHGHAAQPMLMNDEWHRSTQYDGSGGRASGSGWRWACRLAGTFETGMVLGRPAMAPWLLVLLVLLVLVLPVSASEKREGCLRCLYYLPSGLA